MPDAIGDAEEDPITHTQEVNVESLLKLFQGVWGYPLGYC